MRRALLALAAVGVTSAAFAAPSPVGNWNGKINFKTPPIPANASAEQKKMMTSMLDNVRKMVIKLNVKKDGTYTVVAPDPMSGKSNTQTGKWTAKGNQITLKSTQKDPRGGTSDQVFTLSKDGKTLTTKLPMGPGGDGSLVFKKA